VLNDLEDLIDAEVVGRLQTAVLAGPGQGFAILTIWLELQQRVVDAVEQYLVVDVLALREEDPQHLRLAAWGVDLLSGFLTPLF
jgi:hypothetical protein